MKDIKTELKRIIEECGATGRLFASAGRDYGIIRDSAGERVVRVAWSCGLYHAGDDRGRLIGQRATWAEIRHGIVNLLLLWRGEPINRPALEALVEKIEEETPA